MIVNIKAKNMTVKPALKEYMEKRLSKFDKMLTVEEVSAAISVIKDTCRVEVTIPYRGVIIRAEEEGYDMYSCIDIVVEKLESQILKYKSRLNRKGHGTIRNEAPLSAFPASNEEESEKPVRIKHFPIKPMPVDEAIMQMNLLGHNFYVFSNTDDETVNVVYRRKDGAYGLLVPEQ